MDGRIVQHRCDLGESVVSFPHQGLGPFQFRDFAVLYHASAGFILEHMLQISAAVTGGPAYRFQVGHIDQIIINICDNLIKGVFIRFFPSGVIPELWNRQCEGIGA